MKPTPLLLLCLLSFAAAAQPIYRCESASGQVSFQDRACSAQPAEPAVQTASATFASFDTPSYLPGGWTDWQRVQRRRQAKIESREEAARTQMLLQPASDRRAAEYAQSNQRCQTAKRVASLCGFVGPTFSCNEKGFQAEPLTETSTPAPSEVVDHGSAFKREQCALQVTRGRF
jgi:hypothetical protein